MLSAFPHLCTLFTHVSKYHFLGGVLHNRLWWIGITVKQLFVVIFSVVSWYGFVRLWHTNCVAVIVKAKLQPNIGFTLQHVLVVFAHSAVTPWKVNRFGWNLEHSRVHCRGLALACSGCDLRSSDFWRARQNFFVRYAMHDFTDVLLAKFHEIWIQHVDRCHDENFWNRILKILS